MTLIKNLRGCDQFGASISLTHEGRTSSGTPFGGLISICLECLISAYFIMRILAVFNYQDPAITSYLINEDRGSMDEPLNFADYHQQLAFVMLNMNS